MVNFTVDEIRRMMDVSDMIRNISVIAHVDHGKSTLTDSLIAAGGIIAKAKAGDARFMDTRDDEQARTITIKSTAVSLYFEMNGDDLTPGPSSKFAKIKEEKHSCLAVTKTPGYCPFLINVIDSPGHVDFSSEVTAALRVTDGALVVVDCIEGVCVQTETVLRQAISERIKPVLFVNKLDRCFLELHMDLEECYQSFSRAIESVNVIIATYNDELLGDVQVYPAAGTVGFGSGLQSWGFTIERFGKMYAKKFGVSLEKMMKKLWGDNYFDAETKKWTSKSISKSKKRLNRGFCDFILKPIDTLCDSVMNGKTEAYTKMLKKLGVTIPKEANDLREKPLLKSIMQAWLPASVALLGMIINHLPSPVVAQAYRCENLYTGPMDDPSAESIRKCDKKGELMMYVSKMVPTSEKGRFYAFGRVFGGTINTGQQVRIYGPDYTPGKKTDLHIKKIQRTVLMMGRYVEQMPDCPAGNIIGLVGVDSYLLKCGTVCSHAEAFPFHTMKYSVSPVVRVAVEVQNASDLPKLIEGLKRLAKSDPLVLTFTAPTGEHIVAGAGELHLEICLKDLQDDFMKGAPIKISDPVVSFCETVRGETEFTCVAKSPNKHNRIYLTAEPLGDEVTKAIEDNDIFEDQETKVRARLLADEYDWDVTEARKIWTFGCPPDSRANLLVDVTKGVQYLNEVKDSMVGAFIQASACGILCEEAMRGVRFNLEDMTMHADAIHRGAGQIMGPTKRAMYACQIKSQPALLEPMYVADIVVPNHAVSGVYSTLNQRRGVIELKEDRPGTPLCKVKAFLPVLESFGFTQLLRANTSGQAFPQMIFSHWQELQGDVYDEGSQANKVCLDVRKRKGLKEGLAVFGDFYDKI
jgi:elongation factor 2